MPKRKPGQRKDATVVLVDHHPIVREGLAALINQAPGLLVKLGVADGDEALQAIEMDPPDLAIVDIALRAGDGLDLVKTIRSRRPEVRVLVFSFYAEEVYADRVIRAGGHGYVSKDEELEVILAAINQILAGGIHLSPNMQSKIFGGLSGSRPTVEQPFDKQLTDRELEVYRLIGTGRTNRQIAQHLNLSIKTIESHRERIKIKLQIQSGTELTHRAVQWVETEKRH